MGQGQVPWRWRVERSAKFPSTPVVRTAWAGGFLKIKLQNRHDASLAENPFAEASEPVECRFLSQALITMRRSS